MPVRKLWPRGVTGAALVAMMLTLASIAVAAPGKQKPADRSPSADRSPAGTAPAKAKPVDRAPSAKGRNAPSDIGPVTGGMQHGPMDGHLPGSSENVELIGELEPLVPFGAIAPGQIADLAVYKGFAYLNSWNEPTCTKGGFYAVDIRDPRNPQQVSFEPALEGRYHGEGAHVITVDTKTFDGDLLAVNNEHATCPDVDVTTDGGFDLYDVSDPSNPRPLVQGSGDNGGEGRMNGTPAGQHLPQRVHVEGRRQGLSGRNRQRGVPRRRHLRHHGPAEAEAGRRVRPAGELPADLADGPVPAAGGDLQSRHGHQGDRRARRADQLLLGRRLRDARRREPGEGEVHRGHRLRGRGSAGAGDLAARGQRARGRSSRTTARTSSGPTRTSTRTARTSSSSATRSGTRWRSPAACRRHRCRTRR